jgi:hypothetical protein
MIYYIDYMFKKKSKAATNAVSKADVSVDVPVDVSVDLKSLLKASSDSQRLKYEQSIETIANEEMCRIKKEIPKQIKVWIHRPDETSLFRYRYLYINNNFGLSPVLDELALGDLRKSLSSKVDQWLKEQHVVGQADWNLRECLTANIDILWPPKVQEPPPPPPPYTA